MEKRTALPEAERGARRVAAWRGGWNQHHIGRRFAGDLLTVYSFAMEAQNGQENRKAGGLGTAIQRCPVSGLPGITAAESAGWG